MSSWPEQEQTWSRRGARVWSRAGLPLPSGAGSTRFRCLHLLTAPPSLPPRDRLEQLAEELRQAQQQGQAATREAHQHLQSQAELVLKLERSQEALQGLQQQVGPAGRAGQGQSLQGRRHFC